MAVCSRRVCGALAERAARWPRPRRGSRVLVPSVPRLAVAVCPRRACGCARDEGAVLPPRVPRSSSECRVLASRERSWCARDEGAALPPLEPPCPRRACRGRGACRPSAAPPTSERPCPSPACRRGVLVSREPWRPRRVCGRRVPVVRVRPRPSSECGRPRARVDGAVCPRRTSRGHAPATRERPRLRRECRRHGAAVCSCRASGVLVPMEPSWCARVERAAVLAHPEPRPCASVDGAAAHEPRERPPAPSPRVPPCPRRGSGTLVPWAPCPNGGRAFAERAALIVSHR